MKLIDKKYFGGYNLLLNPHVELSQIWELATFNDSTIVISFDATKLKVDDIISSFGKVEWRIHNKVYFVQLHKFFDAKDLYKIKLLGIPLGAYEDEQALRNFLSLFIPRDLIFSATLNVNFIGQYMNSGTIFLTELPQHFIVLKKKKGPTLSQTLSCLVVTKRFVASFIVLARCEIMLGFVIALMVMNTIAN
jgi:hypothetical protein